MKDIDITIASKPLDYMIYYFRLVFSKYNYIKVILLEGKLSGFIRGITGKRRTKVHRIDFLAAAYKKNEKGALIISLKQIKYSVPERLLWGHALTVNISQKDIFTYLGSSTYANLNEHLR